MIPSREQALVYVEQFNNDPFHLRHALIVAGVTEWFAKQYDDQNTEYWYLAGLLHDIDFELYPEEHCVKGEELLLDLGIDEDLVRSAMSHGYHFTATEHAPQVFMEKVLFAIDELTGLIGAVAIMRPSGSVSDLELKSVKKKFKQPSFAAGVSREAIQMGADMLGWQLDDLIESTIEAMRSLDIVE